MKYFEPHFRKLGLAVLVFTLVQLANGQRTDVTETEIDALVAKAAEARKAVSYSVKNVTLDYQLVRSSTISEYVPPDRERVILERPSATGTSKREIVSIGQSRYIRVDGGPWKTESVSRSGGGSGGTGSGGGTPGIPPKVEVKLEHRIDQRLNNVSTDLYEKIRTITFSLPTGKAVRIVTKQYWFDKAGRLLKERDEDRFKNSGRSYVTVWEYAYESKIEIEAPIK